jgi:hypothetical protein
VRLAAGLLLAASLVIAACGTISTPGTTTRSASGPTLGQPIATAPITRAATSPTTTTRPGTVPRDTDSVRLPPPPSPAAPRSRALVRDATRFANAYLLYQIGHDPRPVQRTIRAMCTPSFARLLLSQPVSIPTAERATAAAQPSELESVTYTGSASLGPGSPVQIVIVRYHAIGRPAAGGRLTIELIGSGGRWLVSTLR